MPAIFGYTLEEFSRVTCIEEFIPSPIKWNHKSQIKNWVNSMESRYFKKISLAYCEKKSGSLFLAESFYDYKFSELYNDFIVHVFMFAME